MPFTELCATSNFTFLTGGSHAKEYMLRAELGLIAIADRNSVSGIVRAHVQTRDIRDAVTETKRREAGEDLGPSILGLELPPDTVVPRLIPAARNCLRNSFKLQHYPATGLPGVDLTRCCPKAGSLPQKGNVISTWPI